MASSRGNGVRNTETHRKGCKKSTGTSEKAVLTLSLEKKFLLTKKGIMPT